MAVRHMTEEPTRSTSVAAGDAAVRDGAETPPPTGIPSAGGAVTLFEVPFATAMSESDVARLARALDLAANFRSGASPGDDVGFARLDHSSGVFLERSIVEGQWILHARTWGHPAPQTIHEWHVLTAGAARQLDPTVNIPDLLPANAPQIHDRRVGRASNKRLTRIRRRLVGLS